MLFAIIHISTKLSKIYRKIRIFFGCVLYYLFGLRVKATFVYEFDNFLRVFMVSFSSFIFSSRFSIISSGLGMFLNICFWYRFPAICFFYSLGFDMGGCPSNGISHLRILHITCHSRNIRILEYPWLPTKIT